MSDAPPPRQQQIVLVTGMSGAGKTTTLRVLEDLGWEAIDNFPVRLLDTLVSETVRTGAAPLAIGADSRTRGFNPARIVERARHWDDDPHLSVTTLFLDCRSTELERRFNETRRRHPLAQGRPVIEGIRADRELLEPLRRWAQSVIDTSELSSNSLQQLIRRSFAKGDAGHLSLTISSFGFARGMPPLADFVFDMRFLENPHWHEALRDMTGLDPEVGAFLDAVPAFGQAFERIHTLIRDLLPRFLDQGKSHVHIAFGCTGGRHRSVYTAECMAKVLRDAGFSPTVLHRNLASRTADEIEQGAG